MSTTTHFNLPKPDDTADVDEEFIRLQGTLDLLDSILKTLQDLANGKAAASHTHSIAQITDLATQLAAKMPASQTFKLDDLTDVSGADGAATGYLMIKSALGWVPSSPIAALGAHGHLISEITGLVDALSAKADASTTTSALSGKSDTGHGHSNAATGSPGFMSGDDKDKLDGIAAGANATAAGDNAEAIAGVGTTPKAWPATELKAAALTYGSGWTHVAPVATTSGTAFDLTSIPSTVTEIYINLDLVRATATTSILLQIGTGGSPTTSGYYASASINQYNIPAVTTAFPLFRSEVAHDLSGWVLLRRFSGTNVWVCSGGYDVQTLGVGVSGGRVALAGALDNLRLSIATGAFNQGQFSVSYR